MGLSLGADNLQGYMRRKGYSIENLRDCGLVVGDKLADAFQGRIIVPILDGMGNVVAFGGRIYRGEQDVAKYKNSTNTEIFDKGRTVYGINFVKREKKQSGGFNSIILVEGYMDVIALGSVGIKNVVAGMGTALTEGQAREISRLAPLVYVCYDGDGAGKKATIKNVEILQKTGVEVKVVSLAEGCDPDDTIKQEGYEGFMARVKSALPIIEYKLKLCHDAYNLDSVDGRTKYVRAALKVLGEITSASEKEVYLGIVSRLSGVSVDTLTKDLGKTKASQEHEAVQVVSAKEDKTVKAGRFVLNKILTGADFADYKQINKDWLVDTTHQSIFGDVVDTLGKVKIATLFDKYDHGELGNIVGDDVVFEHATSEQNYYHDCIMVLANNYISKQLEGLTKQYNAATEYADKKAIIATMAQLQQKLKSKNLNDKL
jgi:DNA primase